MGAGKSLDLLRINNNYNNLNKTCLLLKPEIDTRWDKDKINSRLGISAPCITFGNSENLYELVIEEMGEALHSCVLVDEVQFLTPNQAWQLSNVVDWLDIPVLCFGLRTDYNGNTFKGSSVLLGISDEISELKMLCHCNKKATMTGLINQKTKELVKSENLEDNIHIGDSDYIALCRRCWVSGNLGL